MSGGKLGALKDKCRWVGARMLWDLIQLGGGSPLPAHAQIWLPPSGPASPAIPQGAVAAADAPPRQHGGSADVQGKANGAQAAEGAKGGAVGKVVSAVSAGAEPAWAFSLGLFV